MARIYKCTYCKEPIDNPDDLIEYSPGKRRHKKCHEKALAYKVDFYKLNDLLLQIFKIPKLTGIMMKHINKLKSDGYELEVIYLAAKLSESAMYKNLDKPWPYHYAILQNNLPLAIQQKKEMIIRQKQKEFEKKDVPDIIIKSTPGNKQVVDKYDMSNL